MQLALFRAQGNKVSHASHPLLFFVFLIATPLDLPHLAAISDDIDIGVLDLTHQSTSSSLPSLGIKTIHQKHARHLSRSKVRTREPEP